MSGMVSTMATVRRARERAGARMTPTVAQMANPHQPASPRLGDGGTWEP